MTDLKSTPTREIVAETATNTGPGPLQKLGDQEWQILCEKDDRTSPAEYQEILLITRAELGAAMSEAYLLAKDQDRAACVELAARAEAAEAREGVAWNEAVEAAAVRAEGHAPATGTKRIAASIRALKRSPVPPPSSADRYEKLEADVMARIRASESIPPVMAGDLLAAFNAVRAELKYAREALALLPPQGEGKS